jgi:hypothetical protein
MSQEELSNIFLRPIQDEQTRIATALTAGAATAMAAAGAPRTALQTPIRATDGSLVDGCCMPIGEFTGNPTAGEIHYNQPYSMLLSRSNPEEAHVLGMAQLVSFAAFRALQPWINDATIMASKIESYDMTVANKVRRHHEIDTLLMEAHGRHIQKGDEGFFDDKPPPPDYDENGIPTLNKDGVPTALDRHPLAHELWQRAWDTERGQTTRPDQSILLSAAAVSHCIQLAEQLHEFYDTMKNIRQKVLVAHQSEEPGIPEAVVDPSIAAMLSGPKPEAAAPEPEPEPMDIDVIKKHFQLNERDHIQVTKPEGWGQTHDMPPCAPDNVLGWPDVRGFPMCNVHTKPSTSTSMDTGIDTSDMKWIASAFMAPENGVHAAIQCGLVRPMHGVKFPDKPDCVIIIHGITSSNVDRYIRFLNKRPNVPSGTSACVMPYSQVPCVHAAAYWLRDGKSVVVHTARARHGNLMGGNPRDLAAQSSLAIRSGIPTSVDMDLLAKK